MLALIMTVYFGIPSYNESAATLTISTMPNFKAVKTLKDK